MSNRKGIELLRYAVKLFNDCNETFNQRFTGTQLLTIADCMQRCEWDIYPDQWTERQVQECIQFGMVPKWEDKSGDPIPIYHNKSERVRQLAVTWTAQAIVEVNADTLAEAIDWAEGDMPTPKDSEYMDDSFQVVDDITRDMNPN